jgi:glutaconate CoA-transferase subunit B
VRHSHRTFVERVDFVTSVGFGSGPGTRQRLGLPGRGPVLVITDLGMLRPNPQSCELTLETVHPGVDVTHVVEATGWSLQIAEDLQTSPPPTTEELTVLRDLKERTRQASAREA